MKITAYLIFNQLVALTASQHFFDKFNWLSINSTDYRSSGILATTRSSLWRSSVVISDTKIHNMIISDTKIHNMIISATKIHNMIISDTKMHNMIISDTKIHNMIISARVYFMKTAKAAKATMSPVKWPPEPPDTKDHIQVPQNRLRANSYVNKPDIF